jgi:hypothetical protein
MPNTFKLGDQEDYPEGKEGKEQCFIINMDMPLRNADVPLQDVENKLRDHTGLQKSLQARGWNRIPDSQRAEEIINTLSYN